MPSYIEIEQNGSFPAASAAGRVVLGINLNGQVVTTNSSGVTTSVTDSNNYRTLTDADSGTTLLTTDYILFISTNTTPTFALPSVATMIGKTMIVIKNGGSGTVSLTGSIVGGSTYTISSTYGAVTLISDGSLWNIVSSK